MKKITISIMNLGTYEWEYFDITDLESYKKAIRLWNSKKINYDSDYEIQLIDWDYVGRIDEDYLYRFLKVCDEYSIEGQTLIYLIEAVGIDTAEEIIENGELYYIVEADSKKEAFEEYAKELNLIQIPDHLESYIDWNRVLEDYSCGSLVVERVSNGLYVII